MEKASILINEKLHEDVINNFDLEEVNEFLDLSTQYFAQMQNSACSNQVFIHNYIKLSDRKKLLSLFPHS